MIYSGVLGLFVFLNFSAENFFRTMFSINISLDTQERRHCPAKCALQTEDSAEETGISVNWGK